MTALGLGISYHHRHHIGNIDGDGTRRRRLPVPDTEPPSGGGGRTRRPLHGARAHDSQDLLGQLPALNRGTRTASKRGGVHPHGMPLLLWYEEGRTKRGSPTGHNSSSKTAPAVCSQFARCLGSAAPLAGCAPTTSSTPGTTATLTLSALKREQRTWLWEA
ncbi:unnamed protein product [Urochloa humidicola]